MARATASRSLHGLGLAAWFGGALANAVAGAMRAVNSLAGEQQRGSPQHAPAARQEVVR